MRKAINFLNEVGQLARTPRTGFVFLGTGQQSVAEHSYNVAMICFILADLSEEPVNRERLLMLALSHDLLEARTGDLNYVYKRYSTPDDDKAASDLAQGAPSGIKVVDYINEFEEEQTLEAKLANDADQLEMLLVLKYQADTGNPRAMIWFDLVIQRVRTPLAKRLAEEIRVTPSDEWWVVDRKDPHWVHGGRVRSES